MIIDKYGLPIDSDACNAADSARLAGIMAVINHPKTPDLQKYEVNKESYMFLSINLLFWKGAKYVRHPFATQYPENEPRCMSRDQLVCLAAGYKQKGSKWEFYDKWFAPNNMHERWEKGKKKIQMFGRWKTPDLLSPSVRNHFLLCASKEGTRLGYKWLALDIWWNTRKVNQWKIKFDKYKGDIMQSLIQGPPEQNQLICMCVVAGPEWVKKYVENNKGWSEALRKYWVTDRQIGEPELYESIVKYIESYL